MKSTRDKSIGLIELFFRGFTEGLGWAFALFILLVILKTSGIYGFHIEASWFVNDLAP